MSDKLKRVDPSHSLVQRALSHRGRLELFTFLID